MKTLYTLTLLLALTSFGVTAQNFTWVTNDTIDVNLDLNTTVLLKMEQAAIVDTVTLGVEVIYNDLPAGWDGMLCIHGTCFGVIPPVGTTGTMAPVSGSEYGYVRLTVNPLNGTEVAKLQVYVFDVDYPNDGDTATWLLNRTLNVGNDLSLEDLNVYPNPVVNDLHISSNDGVQYIEFHTLGGQMVLRESNLLSGKIDLSTLDSGMYIVTIVGENGDLTTQKILKK